MISSVIAYLDTDRAALWNTHPSRSPESCSAANRLVVLSANGLSPCVMSLGEVVTYSVSRPLHWPHDRRPNLLSQSQSDCVAGLDTQVGICHFTGSQCRRGCRCCQAGRVITGCVACTPSEKPCVNAFCPNFVVSADAQVGSSCFTFWAPPAIFIPMPLGRPVLLERTSKASARALLARR